MVNLLSDRNTTLEIAAKLNGNHIKIKKDIKKTGKNFFSKVLSFKNIAKRYLKKLKMMGGQRYSYRDGNWNRRTVFKC